MTFFSQANALVAQEICSDTIFPLKTKKIIFDCCIDVIKDENFVIYTKNGQHFAVEAMAIIKDGLYIPLSVPDKQAVQIQNPPPSVMPKAQPKSQYKYDYEKYAKRYRTGRTIGTIGAFVSVAGAAMTIGALISNSRGTMPYDQAVTLTAIGFFAFNFGVPTMIIGFAMSKNSKQAMIRTKQQSLDLSLGVTNHGVGLILKL
mgnify:CR=1 FL=1